MLVRGCPLVFNHLWRNSIYTTFNSLSKSAAPYDSIEVERNVAAFEFLQYVLFTVFILVEYGMKMFKVAAQVLYIFYEKRFNVVGYRYFGRSRPRVNR